MPHNAISVVIPAFNEADNLPRLIKRIHEHLSGGRVVHEIIIVDDFSTDHTAKVVKALAKLYKVRRIEKVGRRGKALSLLQGFAKARYPIIAMIDADLQYPTDAIVPMMEKTENGVDIVVGRRSLREKNGVRYIASTIFQRFFVRWLHGLKEDSQSGLKVFKKDVLKLLVLNPKAWTFDLEFLVRAREAGFTIAGHDIAFNSRFSGYSKLHLLQAMGQIASEAIKLKLNPNMTSNAVPSGDSSLDGFVHNGKHYTHYSQLPHNQSALFNFNVTQKHWFTVLVAGLTVALLWHWHTTVIIVLGLMTYFYFLDLLFILYLVGRTLKKRHEIQFSKRQIKQLTEAEMPTYTIFCPLYKEWQVLGQFVEAMKRIDYPKNKLQVMLLLEENDLQTQKQAAAMRLPTYFETVVVPNTLPKTKPKACNYGLQFAKGEYAVIYDAEDVPDPLQLKKAYLAFNQSGNQVRCVQAKLNFYNPHQNILTRFFTAEYSLWFDLILPGLQSIYAPIPLGGTSNHFRIHDLKSLQGWDAFNVTEDCDLGIRLATKGFVTVIIDSETLEEANSNLSNWFNQRTRWLKGYLQTYFVHMRQFPALLKSSNHKIVVGIQLVVGGKVLSLLINPFMWVLSIVYFAFRPQVGSLVDSFFPAQIFYVGALSFVVGNFLYGYYFMIATVLKKEYGLTKYMLLIPVYWLMMSLAAWNAIVGLIVRPHYWFKTKHGLHLHTNRKVRQHKGRLTQITDVEPAIAYVR